MRRVNVFYVLSALFSDSVIDLSYALTCVSALDTKKICAKMSHKILRVDYVTTALVCKDNCR